MNDLKINSFADLYELRELWGICLADMWGEDIGFGAQTINVHEDRLKGVFTKGELANEALRRRTKLIDKILDGGDIFDQERVLARHNVYPGNQETGIYILDLKKITTSISQLREENGNLYWDRPANVFDKNLRVGDKVQYSSYENVPTLFIFEGFERDPAGTLKLDQLFRSRI